MDIQTVRAQYLPQISQSSSTTDLDLSMKVIKGPQLPYEFIRLRKEIYCDETNFLPADKLFDENDERGSHILLYDGGELVAATCVTPADQGNYSFFTGISAEEFRDANFHTRSMVAKSHRKKGLMKLVLYLAMREGRMNGKKRYVLYVEPGENPGWKILKYQNLVNAKPRVVNGASGKDYEVIPKEGLVNEGAIRAFNALPENLQTWVAQNCFIEELTKEVLTRVQEFYQNSYFEGVRTCKLTRSQYVESLMNKYQFVKWTTRILGRAVSICEDPALRRHYADHLAGEINHEVWIENDLAYLGADVNFVKNYMVPDLGVISFMFIQEALTASRQDPIMFLAVPIAIEAASGFLDGKFVSDLKDCIRSWGYDQPSKGCTFFASHIHTDGADDGHWINTLKILGKYMTSEYQHQYMLQIVNLVMNSIDQAYGSYITKPNKKQVRKELVLN